MSEPKVNPALQIVRLIVHRRRWILVPTMVCTALGLGLAVARTRYWSASQTLVVRDDLSGSRQRGLGRFDSTEQLKSAQETILEITRNRSSVLAALQSIGPPPQGNTANSWPSSHDITAARGRITVRAPNGAEFGKTEVILVEVESESRERALGFVNSICDQLQNRLRDLRLKRMQSIVDELEEHVRLAENDLNRATSAIEAVESDLGGDLAELRLLSQSGSGDSHLRSQQGDIQSSLRDVEAQHLRYCQQRDLLAAGLHDPNHLIATPSSLLDSQPSLRRLRDDLANAQRLCAELQGTLTREHPKLRTASIAERESRNNLVAELQVAMRGVESDLAASEQRRSDLKQSLQDINRRLDRIAGLRARYTNLTSDLNQCSQGLDKSRKELADARAGQAAAVSASSLLQLDPPTSSEFPIGPSQSMIVLSGFLTGLSTGGLLLFMLTPLGQTSLRRCSDYLPFGRRQSDSGNLPEPHGLPGGRRESDPPVKSRAPGDLDATDALTRSYVCTMAGRTTSPIAYVPSETFVAESMQAQ